MKISIIVPIYNEENNLRRLFNEFYEVLLPLEIDYEIIGVNDGSKDNSLAILKELALKDKKVKIICFKVNSGQTASICAGIDNSTGDLIIPIDSDLENDPHDISRLIEKINSGYDVVSGWRKDRWSGKLLTRKVPSIVANWLISIITKVKLHDYGCTLKAYKSEVIKGVTLYGEMHRFIPAYASWRGARVTEIIVNYRKRIHGKTNYGLSRTFRVLLDLVVIKFLDKYMNRPIHFFGSIGFISLGTGLLSGLVAIYLRLFYDLSFILTPLPIFSALFIIVGIQLIAMGIIAEILMRTYYESQSKKPYTIEEKINFK